MKPLFKINNKELTFRLNLNYNNAYACMRMLLGSEASLFANLVTHSTTTVWYAPDEAVYQRLTDAPSHELPTLKLRLGQALEQVRQRLKQSPELAPWVDDILEVPDLSFVFYRKKDSSYAFVITAWGCKYAHTASASSLSSVIRCLGKKTPVSETAGFSVAEAGDTLGGASGTAGFSVAEAGDTLGGASETAGFSVTEAGDTLGGASETAGFSVAEAGDTLGGASETAGFSVAEAGDTLGGASEKKSSNSGQQQVYLRVLDLKGSPVIGESIEVVTVAGVYQEETSEEGLVDLGYLPCSSQFKVTFPNLPHIQERSFEVEPKVEYYEACIKKLVKYAPVLFVEDQHGNLVQHHEVKIVLEDQEAVYNTGEDGMIQLPTMYDGQKFVAIDTMNYATTEEYDVTPEKAKSVYRFHIQRPEKVKVGITVVDAAGKPIPQAVVSVEWGHMPCQQTTGEDGRAEFPEDVFQEGIVPIGIKVKKKSKVRYDLEYQRDVTEYGIRISRSRFDWRWLALLPLLALLACGAWYFWPKTPTWEELNKGVVLIKTERIFTVSTGLPEKSGLSTLYFNYDANERKILNATFDKGQAAFSGGWGTGFFISKDGMIATNRHIAFPIAPEEEIVALIKEFFLSRQTFHEQKAHAFQKLLNKYSGRRNENANLSSQLDQVQDSLDIYRSMAHYYDRILKLSNYKVNTICNTYAAFDNSMIQTMDDQAFHPCTCLAYGEPGDVNSNDLAIIQLNEKEKIVPKDAYIFEVSDQDPFSDDKEQNEDYTIWVLGYNAGAALAGTDVGIHPQHVKGSLSSTNRKYQVQYSTGTIGGSSGSPVLNKNRELVAINNSGFANSTIGFGVRVPYLYELLQQVREKRNVTKTNSKN